MNYVFSRAPKPLLFALYLKNVLEEEVTLITCDKDTIKYCDIEKIEYIQFELKDTRFEFGKYKIASIYKLSALKKMMDEVIEKINPGKEDKFFLVGLPMKAFDSFYLAKELSKKCVVYHRNPHDRQISIFKSSKYKSIFFRGEILRIMLKIVFGLDLMYYEYNNNPTLGVDDKFLKKYNISIYLPGVSSRELDLNTMKKTKSSYKEYDNVIIDDRTPLENVTKFDSTKKVYEELFSLPIDFAFKKHPTSTSVIPGGRLSKSFYKIFKNCEEIPRYIPAELLCNNIKKSVISIHSVTLIAASQLPHLKSVSLLELVDWYNESYKKEFKNYLIEKSDNKIIFPNSVKELKEILLN